MSGIIDQGSYNYNTYRHGIISQRCLARKYPETNQVQPVSTGTFVQVLSITGEDVLFCIVNESMQGNTTRLICNKADIIHVPENLWGPLFTVKESARLPLVKDRRVAESIGNIAVGHTVQVLGTDNTIICTATVTFKNSIARLGVGTYFGLRVLAPKENLQMIIKKVSCLEPGTKGFPRGCDIVVTIDRLLLCNKEKSSFSHYDKENQRHSIKSFPAEEDVNNASFKSAIVLNLKDKISNNFRKGQQLNSPDSEMNSNHSSSKKIINSDIPLVVGDEVVYLDEDTPEKGVVRWIGWLGNSLNVGVEFVNPIGSGTGTVDGVELFKTKHQHALIVPPMALIKLSDYVMNSSKETKRNNNNNNLNNINNNNNNINNNGDCNNVRSNEFCCEGRPTIEDKYEKPKKVSIVHQCLKHPERTFDCNESFQSKEGLLEEPYLKQSGHKSECPFELEFQHNSKSFDLSKPSERKASYRRNCSSVDGDPDFLLNVQSPKGPVHWSPPSRDAFDFAGGKQEKSLNCYYPNEKLSKELEEELFPFHKTMTSHMNEIKPEYSEKENWGSQYSEHSSSDENLANFYDPSKPGHSSCIPQDLEKGSVVELTFKGEPHYGVIRWIGTLPEDRDDGGPPRLVAGVEMEEEWNELTDGTFKNRRYFQCNPKKALFIPLSKCRKDSRFLDESQRQNLSSKINYGQIDCPIVEGTIPPINRKGDIESICGKNRGIQGHHNSCYLDATLFSMFAFTSVFDSLLYRPPTKNDIPQYSEVQRVLREEIVNPLRKNLYVRADRVMKLRTLLDKLSSVSGLTSEEKDPEEFLNSLLAQILKAEPFLKLSSGQEAFHYQLFVEKDERLVFPSVQQLFEQSFMTSDIKLKQVPSCLIIQMPRFGKSFKMYSRILPPQLLDVTDIIEHSPRQCFVCGKLAEFECKDCFGQHGIGNGLESISFCKNCLGTAHHHHCRSRHNSRALTVPVEFSELQEHCIIPRLYMELFAVVCIETSHYVAFVKCGSGSDAPWCFFDSMADRKGEQNGYNIPEMVPCPDLPYWLSEDGAKMLNEMRDERQLPEHAKRLFSDAYMCMYQSPDLMMYR